MRKLKLVPIILFLSLFAVSCKGASDREEKKSDLPIVQEDMKGEERNTALDAKETVQDVNSKVNIDKSVQLTGENVESISLEILKAKYGLNFTMDHIEPNFSGNGYLLTVKPENTPAYIVPLNWYFEICDNYEVRCDYDKEYYKYHFDEYYNGLYQDYLQDKTYMFTDVMYSNQVKPLEVFLDHSLDRLIKNDILAVRFHIEREGITNYINTDDAIALANAMLNLAKVLNPVFVTEIEAYGIVISPEEKDLQPDQLTNLLSFHSLVADPLAEAIYVTLDDHNIYINGEFYGENATASTMNGNTASGNVGVPIYYLDETSVDLTKFKTMDVSELYDMETFTFDVPIDLNITPDKKYASINDLFYIYTSDDVVMMNGKTAMNALHMGMPSDTKLKNSEYYNDKSDTELIDMIKEFIKDGQGKEAYDFRLTEQNGYKILSYKYVGNAIGNSNINGHIYIFYMDEKKIKAAEDKGENINKYLDKYIELTYYSPQSEVSSTRDPLKEEIDAFDQCFDQMVKSIKLK